MSTFSKILVAVDGGEFTEKITKFAVRIADHADVHFVIAFDPDLYFDDAAAVVFDAVRERASALEKVRRVVDRCVGRANDAGIRATSQIVEEAPVNAILHTAEHIGADLIVMASHGRSGLARVVLGSVAEGVARRASVPVLFVPTRLADEGVDTARYEKTHSN